MHGQRSFRGMYWIHIWRDQTLHSPHRMLSAHPAVWQGTFAFGPTKGTQVVTWQGMLSPPTHTRPPGGYAAVWCWQLPIHHVLRGGEEQSGHLLTPIALSSQWSAAVVWAKCVDGGQTQRASPRHSRMCTYWNFVTPARTWSQRGHTVAPSSADPKKYRGCREQYCKEEEMGLLEKGGEGEGIGEDHLCCKRR